MLPQPPTCGPKRTTNLWAEMFFFFWMSCPRLPNSSYDALEILFFNSIFFVIIQIELDHKDVEGFEIMIFLVLLFCSSFF